MPRHILQTETVWAVQVEVSLHNTLCHSRCNDEGRSNADAVVKHYIDPDNQNFDVTTRIITFDLITYHHI